MTSRRGGDAIARGTTRRARGNVFVVSAPSGAGKTTLCRRLLADLQGIDFSVSFTTRSPREGEREGVDYHFIDRKEFEKRRRKGEFVEWAQVDGQIYGTSGVAVKEATAQGRDMLLDIDTQGAENIRRLIPDAVLVFIMPPSQEALRQRLAGRGTEGPEALARRLGLAHGEVERAPMYDFVVVNDDLETAYQQLRAIVLATRCRRERQMGRIKEIAAGFGAGQRDEG
ncbi:MAG TPA: guanylate kinase [Candidatus Polarisedimenticolia bacterium]|nr:guanylate kinase [Candidatus Polarisedimenticolia bacterium]